MATYTLGLEMRYGTWELYMLKTGGGTGSYWIGTANCTYSVTINGSVVGSGHNPVDFRNYDYSWEGAITIASGYYNVQTGNNSGSATFDTTSPKTASDSYYYTPPTPTYSHTLTYNNNGGTGGPGSSSTTNTSSGSFSMKISTNNPTRENYEFLGWRDDTSSSVVQYQPNNTYTFNSANKTIYACWKSKAKVRTYHGNYEVKDYYGSIEILDEYGNMT